MTPRTDALNRLRERTTWDFVVVGGGATGLGTAVDASTRGYRTLLLEAHDFAQGTSSRSTKLVHGGVRYLANGQIGLVREALRERGRLLRNAPQLVHDLVFLVPAYRVRERAYYSLGLRLYDFLAGGHSLGRSRGVPRDAVERMAPTLRRDGLRGGVLYHDAQFDDARLAVALARTADDHGATVLNRVAVEGVLKMAAGRLRGIVARDAETGERFDILAHVIVNATGVFTDAVRRLDEADAAPIVQPSQGAHLVFDRALFPGETAVLIPRTDDGRVLFLIPWQDRVLVGTTDTLVPNVAMEPKPRAEEVEFLLAHAGRYLERAPRPCDVLSTFAGLRPLVAPRGGGAVASRHVSREHTVVISKSGLVTITGGKWTTYRAMAESAVDHASRVAGLPARPCRTSDLRLHGWIEATGAEPFAHYGSEAEELRRIIAEHPEWSGRLHPRLAAVEAEVVWAARFEAARSVEDVLARRTRSLFLDARASIDVAPRVAALLAAELGRDAAWIDAQIAAFHELARDYLVPD